MVKIDTANKFRSLLHDTGLKATSERLSILEVLDKAKKPLSIKEIREKLRSDAADQATIYRTIESLRKNNVVRTVNFEHDHNHYELVDTNHHHHIICEKCGRVEDISKCDTTNLEKQVARTSGFTKISHHSLEFFGLCKSCARK